MNAPEPKLRRTLLMRQGKKSFTDARNYQHRENNDVAVDCVKDYCNLTFFTNTHIVISLNI